MLHNQLHNIFLRAYTRKRFFLPAGLRLLGGMVIFILLIRLNIRYWNNLQMDIFFMGIVALLFFILYILTSISEAWALLLSLIRYVAIPFLSMWLIFALINPTLVDPRANTLLEAIYVAILRVERIISITLLITILFVVIHPEEIRMLPLIKNTGVAVWLAVLFRFVPMFFQDLLEYVLSIQERGTDITSLSNWKRLSFWYSQVLPLLSKCLVLSFNLADWMYVALSIRQELTNIKGGRI